MPTLPPERPRPPVSEAHRARRAAESFGVDAERYDRSRPRYPRALVERITAASPGPDVLDVGCGTGIAARQLQAAGCRVLGVDPDPRMAGVARRLGTAVEVATFEDWDPADRRFDAVVAAQAWHWIDPAAAAAKAAWILRPGGLLAVFWNAARLPPDLARATAETLRRAAPDAPFDPRALTGDALDGYRTVLTAAADGIRQADGLGDPRQWRHDWELSYTRDAWLDLLPTQGVFTRLTPAALAAAAQDVGAAVDAAGGRVTVRYTTVAVTAERVGAA